MAAAAFVASIAIDFAKTRRLSRTSAVFSVAVLIVMFLGWWDQNQTRAERHSDQQKIDQLTSNLADARREQSGIQRTLEDEVEAAKREREAAEARAERLTLELSSTRATLEDEVEAATLERERARARAQRLELELSETRTTLEGEVEAATRERLLAEARAEAANSEADRSREMLENVIAGLDLRFQFQAQRLI